VVVAPDVVCAAGAAVALLVVAAGALDAALVALLVVAAVGVD